MPTLKQAKNQVKKLTTYQKTDRGEFEPFEAQPGQAHYRKRAQGGYELVGPDTGAVAPAPTPYGGGGTSLWETGPGGPAGPGGRGEDWYLSGFGEWKRVGGGPPEAGGAGAAPGPGGPQPIGTRVTTEQRYTPPAGPMPTFGAPTYRKVGYDPRRVAYLRQQAAGPARRGAIQALQRAFTASYASGPLRDMAIRNALREYGSAYADIMRGAGQEARAEYARETAEQRAANLAEYNAAMAAAQTEFQAAWETWSKSGTVEQIRTEAPAYEGGATPETPMVRLPERMTVPVRGGGR